VQERDDERKRVGGEKVQFFEKERKGGKTIKRELESV